MILLKVTEDEMPILLEALHLFGAELQEILKTYPEEDQGPTVDKIVVLDQIIDVLQLTNKKPVC